MNGAEVLRSSVRFSFDTKFQLLRELRFILCWSGALGAALLFILSL